LVCIVQAVNEGKKKSHQPAQMLAVPHARCDSDSLRAPLAYHLAPPPRARVRLIRLHALALGARRSRALRTACARRSCLHWPRPAYTPAAPRPTRCYAPHRSYRVRVHRSCYFIATIIREQDNMIARVKAKQGYFSLFINHF
jgi:hypothetical protein